MLKREHDFYGPGTQQITGNGEKFTKNSKIFLEQVDIKAKKWYNTISMYCSILTNFHKKFVQNAIYCGFLINIDKKTTKEAM